MTAPRRWKDINPAYPHTDRRSIARLLPLPFPFLRFGLLGRLLGRGRFLVEIDNQFRALSDFAPMGEVVGPNKPSKKSVSRLIPGAFREVPLWSGRTLLSPSRVNP